MKKIFSFGRKKKSGPPSSTSETGSVLSAGYELKEKDLSKIHRAASSGDVAKTRQLLHKQDINQLDKESRTPLHLACANGHLEVVKLLVENKAKLNVCDTANRTPLMKAIQCQHEPCATVLLEHQADPNVVDVNENAALHLAALIPSMSTAVQLLEHGANINAINKDGCTPLILSVTENHQEMVELLIKEGADINSRDSNGRTSLMIASSNGHISLVKYLLQNNADSSIKDLTGWTADDYAVNDGHHACSQLIFEHGSRTKHNNSSPYYGASKKKATSGFGSPDRAVDGAFTLGSPATDKEGTNDLSQVESESSRASEEADSWPSSDEDDLDFSPKKTAKPSLTQLLHTKKNIIEKARFTSVQPKGFTFESKSDSEEDSLHGSEDDGANIQSPPKPFPQARSFPEPVCIKPGSFAKPSQLASASLLGVNKDESFSDDEVDDESAKQSLTAQPEKGQDSADGVGRKVALMTELGFEDDDVESPWDSESNSESPRKQSASEEVLPSVQAHMQCISEESNEDMYYCPSFPKQSRSCEMQYEDWHFRQREASDHSTGVKELEVEKAPILQTNKDSTSNFFKATSEKNKPDVMADLGLDDADDIEDPSDWDSTSHSVKSTTQTLQSVNSPHHKLNEHPSPQTNSDKVTSKENAPSNSGFLRSVPEEEGEDHIQSRQNNSQAIARNLSEQPQNGKTGLSDGNQLTNDMNNTPVGKEKATNERSQVESEKAKGGGDYKSGLQVEPNLQLRGKAKSSPQKRNNGEEKSVSSQADDKASSKKEKRLVNGSMLDAFDDSSLSEISQEEDGRSSGKRTERQKMNEEDLADYSQSSDTNTEDSELPTSAFKDAMLLIRQLNLEGQDSLTFLKIQNIIHEYERVIEKEKGRRALLSREVKKLRRERKEVQQILEENRELKFLLEHHKVEWESDLNNLRLTLKQEEEKRKSAELLYEKSKEQLRKKEDHCCKEMEEKQHLELTLRNLELEMRSLKNNMKQVEEERNDAQRLHAQELNARVLHEGALNNLKRKNEEEEAQKIKNKHAEMLSQFSEINEKEKELTMRNLAFQEESSHLKVEMDNLRSRYQEEESRHMEEKEMLKEKIEDLRKDLKMNEETLTQTVIQYNGQLNALKTETAMMCSKIEHEKQSKERLETELETVRSRLNSTIQDLERSQALKTETERTVQREREEWLRSKDKLTHELSNLRESHSHLSQQLSRTESKLNGLENELHRTGLSLQDKTLLLDNAQRDLTQAQSKIKEIEQALQVEKDHNNKNSVKQESVQERLSQITSENMQLRQQLEDVQNKGIIKEKAVSDVQDRFTDIFSKLRADTERQVHIIEERNKDLITKSNELREQLYKLETEKVERESNVRQLQQELADALKKLSMSEASLEVITRYRNDLEEEKQQLQKELEKFRTKLQDLEDQFVQSERCNHQLKNALDDKEREMIAAFQKLQDFSTAAAGADKAVKQLEEHVQKLEIENARIEATAKQQAGQIESLQRELHESVSMRSRLEDLVTNLQSTKIGLEDKLNQQVHQHSALSQNAQDSQHLWQSELKSRSQIGVRLAELEGVKANLSDQVAVEKKKLKKLAEQKKSIEERFDQEMKRSSKLQQEVAELKKLLKTAKKKLKNYEGPEQRSHLKEGSRNFESDNEVLKLKEKIEELSLQMERDSRKYVELESTNRDLQEDVSTNKKLYRNIEKLERGKRQLEEELAELRRSVDSSKKSQSYLDMYKKEVDERGRQELRQQLEEVNLFLQAHAASQDKLEQMRAESDASVRSQMEHRIQDLESELHRLKNSQLENTSEKDSHKQELSRFKELYTEEEKAKKSLLSKLERANERLAEANNKLLNERQRNKSLIASTFLSGSMGASPVVDTSHLARLSSSLPFNRSLGLGGGLLNTVGNGLAANHVESYFTKMQQELEKNIAKELDQANAELESGSTRISPVGSIAGSLRNLSADQDPVSRATQQYLEVLKKNYMI